MAPPVKFDDLAKTAEEVLSDDFQTCGFQLKGKQKTQYFGAVASTAVDFSPASSTDAARTAAKVTWKLPQLLGPLNCGLRGLSLDKLEMDKAGKFKFEASADKTLHEEWARNAPDLKLEVKSDLASFSGVTLGGTYSGLPDVQVKLETAPAKQELKLEVSGHIPKGKTLELPTGPAAMTAFSRYRYSPKNGFLDFGLRLSSGPLFCAVKATENLSVLSAFGFYKLEELKLAASWTLAGKARGDFSIGAEYRAAPRTNVKAKVTKDSCVHLAFKQEVSKGFTLLGGMKYNAADTTKHTFGLQLSVE